MASPSTNEVAETMVRVIRQTSEIESIRQAWESWPGHRDANIDVYLAVLQSGDASPYILVLEKSGHPDAILLGRSYKTTISSKIGYLHLRSTKVRIVDFVYGGFLGNQSAENSRLLIAEAIRRLQQGDADLAKFQYLRTDLPLAVQAQKTPGLLMRDDFPIGQNHSAMMLSDSVDAVFSGISSKHRGNIRRDAKRFLDAYPDLTIARFRDPGELEMLFRDAEQVALTTYQRALGVGFSDTPQIRNLLTLEARKGWLRGYVLYANKRPCAFWIGCVYNNVFLSEFLGHDPSYGKYSPGTYLLFHVLDEICREGVKQVDFGIGEAQYKQRFGNCSWEEKTISLYAPTFKGMQAKALTSAAVLVNRAGKSVLNHFHLLDTVKKFWRRKAGQTLPSAPEPFATAN